MPAVKNEIPTFIRCSKILKRGYAGDYKVILFETTPTMWQLVVLYEGRITAAKSYIFFVSTIAVAVQCSARSDFKKVLADLHHGKEVQL